MEVARRGRHATLGGDAGLETGRQLWARLGVDNVAGDVAESVAGDVAGDRDVTGTWQASWQRTW